MTLYSKTVQNNSHFRLNLLRPSPRTPTTLTRRHYPGRLSGNTDEGRPDRPLPVPHRETPTALGVPVTSDPGWGSSGCRPNPLLLNGLSVPLCPKVTVSLIRISVLTFWMVQNNE